jgi:DNA repair protein RecO (recombination protein O)
MTRARRTPPAPLAAFVLHRWNWSESSLIVDLFTRELGRVVVAAKGARRPYSQLRPVLLPFQRLTVSIGRGDAAEAAEVLPLRGAEWAGGRPMAGGETLMSGFYVNELLMRLLARHDPHPRLFDAYADTLSSLDTGDDAGAQAALRSFELLLLREIGMLPDLGVVTPTQRAVDPQGRYALRPEAGVVADAGAAGLTGALLLQLQAALDVAGAQALRAACRAHLAPLRGPLRHVLHYHLGSPRLRTPEVARDLQRLLTGTER